MTHERRTLIDDFQDLSGWTPHQGNLSADTSSFALGTQSLKLTYDGTGTRAYAIKQYNQKLTGRYFRLWVDVPTEGITSVGVRLTMGDGTYYDLTLGRSTNRLVTGKQQFDFHLNYMGGTADWRTSSDVLTQVQLSAYSGSGTIGASASFDALEIVSRRPYFVFVNDGVGTPFIEDVLPLVAARGKTADVLLSATGMNALPDGSEPEAAPLALLQDLARRGTINVGLHLNAQQATDEDFRKETIERIANLQEFGLWPRGALHVCAFQNLWTSDDRLDFVLNWARIARQGGGARQPTINFDGEPFHYLPPAASTDLRVMKTLEFTDTTTSEDAEGWIETAVNAELGFFVFGHGSDRFQTPSRAPVSVFQAFFRAYDAHADRIDFLTAADVYERFKEHYGRERNNQFSYPAP